MLCSIIRPFKPTQPCFDAVEQTKYTDIARQKNSLHFQKSRFALEWLDWDAVNRKCSPSIQLKMQSIAFVESKRKMASLIEESHVTTPRCLHVYNSARRLPWVTARLNTFSAMQRKFALTYISHDIQFQTQFHAQTKASNRQARATDFLHSWLIILTLPMKTNYFSPSSCSCNGRLNFDWRRIQ